MKLLLDTHVLLWWLDDDPRISSRARALIGDGGNDVAVSAASIWEIAIKAGLGQLEVPRHLEGYLRSQLARNQFEVLPMLFEHAVGVRDLPVHHRDPFDRLLVAQCRVERLALVTRDARMQAYDIEVAW